MILAPRYTMLAALGFLWAVQGVYLTAAESSTNSSTPSERSPKYSVNWQPTSQPLMFAPEWEDDAQVVNSHIVVKKKRPSSSATSFHVEGPTFFKTTGKVQMVDSLLVNNHQPDEDENHQDVYSNFNGGGIVWKSKLAPQTPHAAVSNHKTKDDEFSRKPASDPWSEKQFGSSSMDSIKSSSLTISGHYRPSMAKPSISKRPEATLNNHKSFNNWIRPKPPMPSETGLPFATVSVVQKGHGSAVPVVGSDRLKAPDKVLSSAMTIYDAPPGTTTIKHKNLIVLKKPSQQTELGIVTSKPLVALGDSIKGNRHNYSVAAVMDPWANIPIPSKPSLVYTKPPKGGGTGTALSTSSSQGAPSMFPGIPVMPFLTSLITPLLKRPLSQNAVNTGMQGIKAMQGFLRNSLIGAMICFLPSALIAISLSATQRAELRQTPEMDRMMVFCKTCLENLKTIKNLARDEPGWWEEMNREFFDE